MGRELALFDFDGTITRSDSMFAFVLHVRGRARTVLGLVWLAPLLLGVFLGLVSRQHGKAMLLRHFLGGMSRADLEAASRRFVALLDDVVRPGARERITWHLDQGHEVWVVSASLDLWLAEWAGVRGLPLVATRAHWEDDLFAGLDGANCRGPEKVRRVCELVDLEVFDRVWAYGDSSGDRELLALADEPSFRPFQDTP